MDEHEKPPALIRYAGPLWFISMALGALVWFSISAFELTQQLLTQPANITFNKGVFYLLGVGIGLGALSFAAAYQFWLNRSLSDRLSTIITRTALPGLLITFTLPHLAHYSVSSYVEARGYNLCREASHQWLHSRIIVFANDKGTCKEIAVQMK